MAIITKDSDRANELLTCVICGRGLPPAHMTAGMVDAQGEQRFACYGHSWEDSKLILGWASFAIKQRPMPTRHTKQTSEVYVERRPTTGNDIVSWDIAHHLFTRQLQGKIAVLTSNPLIVLSALRKQWLRMARKVQRERSSTLDVVLIGQLARTISHMQGLVFTAKLPYEEPGADLYVLSDKQLQELPLNCHTVYVVDSMADEQLAVVKQAVPRGGLVVVYR